MIQYNIELLEEIRRSRVKQYEIATILGMAPSNFCTLLRTRELSTNMKEKIREAIKEVLKGDEL